MHKSSSRFWVQKDKYVAFVANCSTPASPFFGVFWRKGGERKLALNHWMMHGSYKVSLSRNRSKLFWKARGAKSQRLDLAELKCGLLTKLTYELFTVFQGDWSEALNPDDVCWLLCAVITPCTHWCLLPIWNSSFVVTWLFFWASFISLHFAWYLLSYLSCH